MEKLTHCYSLMKDKKIKSRQDEFKALSFYHTRRLRRGPTLLYFLSTKWPGARRIELQ